MADAPISGAAPWRQDGTLTAMEARRQPRAEIEARIAQALDMVQLTVLRDRLPRQLSERECDVARDGKMGKEGISLEYHAEIALLGWHLIDHPVAKTNGALGWGDKARDHHEQCGLARSSRPKQGQELSRCQRQADVVDRARRAIKLAQTLKV